MKTKTNIKIVDEWTDFHKNVHYIMLEIEGNLILTEIEMSWKTA